MSIKIAISRCLLGDEVRYDGTSKICLEIEEFLGTDFEIIPYCPEVTIGLGVPRPPIRLDCINNNVRARRIDDATIDHTDALKNCATSFINLNNDLAGVISKKGSPSCGYHNAKLFEEDTLINTDASGIFIKEVVRQLPDLLIIDEIDFSQRGKRELFLNAVKLKRP